MKSNFHPSSVNHSPVLQISCNHSSHSPPLHYHVTTTQSKEVTIMNANTHSDSVVIKKTSNVPSLDDSMVSKVYTYSNGDTLEVITPHHRANNLNRFQRLDKYRYVDITTGEIHFYKKSDKKHKSPEDIQRALTALRRLINNNFFGNLSERHIVLTYAEQVDNPKELYRDFKYFMAKLRKHYPYEYICTARLNAEKQNKTCYCNSGNYPKKCDP